MILADLALRPEAQKLLTAYGSVNGNRPRAIFLRTDVVKWEQLSHLFDVADSQFGGCDIVCPGAGVFEPEWSNFWHPPGTQQSKDVLTGEVNGVGHYALFDINLTHPIRMTQLAISRWLKAAKPGTESPKRIVHVSSTAANVAAFVAPMYAASKAAVSSFVKSMAQLDQIGIRVCAVEPGVIKTPLWTDHPEKMSLLDDDQVWVEAIDVAQAMLRCCDDDDIRGGTLMTMKKSSDGAAEWIIRPTDTEASSSAIDSARSEILKVLAGPDWGVAGT